jgi:hypothetical protein
MDYFGGMKDRFYVEFKPTFWVFLIGIGLAVWLLNVLV